MDRSYLRFVSSRSADRIADALTEQQYVAPHQSVGAALDAARAGVGFCALAADRALASLRLDPATTIGRLRRTELMQLARAIYRGWRHSVGGDSLPSQVPDKLNA
ncbi:MAG TPA: hypothetical protein VEA69_06970 [Tepidisphaeraceae bacterium]|nr:hypothetical protein [Tepidisphaeraceae bacterium]